MNATTRMATALCRADLLGTDERWYHTLPGIGEYQMPIHLSGGTVPGIVVIDAEALAQIKARFDAHLAKPDCPGILVDREHASETPDGDTTAMAWARACQVRDDGIWTRWDLTAAGEPLILGHAYAYRSPAMSLEPLDATARAQLSNRPGAGAGSGAGAGRWRPTALKSIALTNVPHFRELSPALGRESTQPTPTGTTMDKNAICAALGLDPASATDEQIMAAIEALKAGAQTATAECTAAKGELAAIKARQAEADADAFCTAHAARIQNAATVRARYLADPEGVKALFGSLAAPQADPARQSHICARDARTPGEAADTQDKGAERGKLVAHVSARDGISRRDAVCVARRERPELWA